MYKTVRHGENSLQYTILPQTEEVLSNSGLKGKGRDYSPSIHVRRSRRKYHFRLTLCLVVSLTVASALLCISIYYFNPIYLDRLLGVNGHGAIAVATTSPSVNAEGSKTRKKELKISPEIISTLISRFEGSTTTSTAAYVTSTMIASRISSTTTGDKATTPPWIMPALKSWKSSSTIQTIPTEGNEIPVNGKQNSKKKEKTAIDNMSIKPWEKDVIIRPTVTPEPITPRSVIKYYSPIIESEKPAAANTKLFDDVLITTKGTTTIPGENTSEQSKLKDLKDAMLSVDDDEEFKESLEVDEVFSLPPLKPEPGIANSDTDEVTVSKTDGGWYGARWPFVDTSSYFQWTGYSPGDNLLLPLLVAALSSMALVLLLALAVKRRKRSRSLTIQIGKLTSELQEEDNTNLLTAENGEDAEE